MALKGANCAEAEKWGCIRAYIGLFEQHLRRWEREQKVMDPDIECQREQQPNEGDNYPLSYEPFAAVTGRANEKK